MNRRMSYWQDRTNFCLVQESGRVRRVRRPGMDRVDCFRCSRMVDGVSKGGRMRMRDWMGSGIRKRSRMRMRWRMRKCGRMRMRDWMGSGMRMVRR